MVHDLTAAPFTRTVHAPQYVVSHPMWTPVRSNSSRNSSTKRSRGSTLAEYSLPFTLTLIDTRRISSGILMAYRYLLAARTLSRGMDRAFHESGYQRSLVFNRAAQVGLWIGCLPRRIHRRVDGLGRNRLTFKRLGCLFRADRSQPDATERYRRPRAYITVTERQVRGRAGGRINRRRTLVCNVCPSALFRRDLYPNLTYQFGGAKHTGIRVRDEIAQSNRPFAFWTDTRDFGFQREQDWRPVAA